MGKYLYFGNRLETRTTSAPTVAMDLNSIRVRCAGPTLGALKKTPARARAGVPTPVSVSSSFRG